MSGSQAGKQRDVLLYKLYLSQTGSLQLQVSDSSNMTNLKTYTLDKIREAQKVLPDADNFEYESPRIRFDDGKHIIVKDLLLLRVVLEEFIAQDPTYPFAADRRGSVLKFLNSR